jgi:hypothetical protein
MYAFYINSGVTNMVALAYTASAGCLLFIYFYTALVTPTFHAG